MADLDQSQKIVFKEKLNKNLDYFRDKYHSIQNNLRELKEGSPDLGDSASSCEQREILVAQSRHIESQVRQTVKAINNFDDYGYCLVCGDDIDINRLDAQPSTTECHHCKELQERLKKRTL